jgi:hypothetical protein
MRFLTVFATMQSKLNERIKTDQVEGHPVKTSLFFYRAFDHAKYSEKTDRKNPAS